MRTIKTVNLTRIAAMALAIVALAAASPAAAATQSAPLASLSMQARVSSGVLIVSADVSTGQSLPAKITVPVPKGATPYWVGEILGTDPSKDPKATYAIEKAKGYDLVVFTLKQSRTGQVEVSLPAAAPAGAPTTLSYTLPITTKVAQASLAFELPAGAVVTSSTAGLTASQDSGGRPLLTISKKNPKRKSALNGSVTFTVPSGGTAAAAGSGSLSNPPDVLTIMLWVFAVGLAGIFGKTVLDRRVADRRAAVQHDSDEEADSADDAEYADDDSVFVDDDVPVRRARSSSAKATGSKAPTKSAAKAAPVPRAKPPAKRAPAPRPKRRSEGE